MRRGTTATYECFVQSKKLEEVARKRAMKRQFSIENNLFSVFFGGAESCIPARITKEKGSRSPRLVGLWGVCLGP